MIRGINKQTNRKLRVYKRDGADGDQLVMSIVKSGKPRMVASVRFYIDGEMVREVSYLSIR